MAISQDPVGVSPSSAGAAVLGEKSPVDVSEVAIAVSHGAEDHPRYIVASPYTEPEHLLDLETLDKENQLLARALTKLECIREDYATAPYSDIFNWAEVIDEVRALARNSNHSFKETSVFVVAFRSKIPPTTVYEDLGTLDKAAHAEATASGGFLKYDLPCKTLACLSVLRR